MLIWFSHFEGGAGVGGSTRILNYNRTNVPFLVSRYTDFFVVKYFKKIIWREKYYITFVLQWMVKDSVS